MINEKTLELNLTFEILTVADQLWPLMDELNLGLAA
jgi:hypothetical protein